MTPSNHALSIMFIAIVLEYEKDNKPGPRPKAVRLLSLPAGPSVGFTPQRLLRIKIACSFA
jgi:hypothetical protein